MAAITALRRLRTDAMLSIGAMCGLAAGQQETRVPMQACGPKFSLPRRSWTTWQGSRSLADDIAVAERPDWWLYCLRDGRIGRSSGNPG